MSFLITKNIGLSIVLSNDKRRQGIMREKAYLAVLTGATIGGTGGLFIKAMSIPASSIACIRMMVPFVLLGGWMWYNRIGFFRGNYKVMLGGSVINAVRMYLFFAAFIYTSIGNAIIVFYTWPIFGTLLGATLLKEHITRRQAGLLVLAFAGIIIAYSNQEFSFDNQDFIGMSAALGSAFLYALTVIIFKTETPNYTRNEIIFYQNIIGALAYIPFLILNEPSPSSMDVTLGISYGLVVGIIGYNFFFFGLKYLDASRASMLTYVEVVSAVLLGYFVLGEVLDWYMMLGGGCIILSTILLRLETQNGGANRNQNT